MKQKNFYFYCYNYCLHFDEHTNKQFSPSCPSMNIYDYYNKNLTSEKILALLVYLYLYLYLTLDIRTFSIQYILYVLGHTESQHQRGGRQCVCVTLLLDPSIIIRGVGNINKVDTILSVPLDSQSLPT